MSDDRWGDDNEPTQPDLRGHLDFASILAHEIRNPLHALETGIALLSQQKRPDRHPHICRMMKRQIDQITRLVDDLLDVKRMVSGKLDIALQRVDLRDCVSLAVSSERHARVVVQVDPDPLWAMADAGRVTQIVSNLLDNALKFSPEDSLVVLSASHDGGAIVITVRDEGQGMTPDEIARAFELFSQARNGRDRKAGVGIGLALVRQLTLLHHGQISVHSDGLGAGTTVRLTIPAADRLGADPP